MALAVPMGENAVSINSDTEPALRASIGHGALIRSTSRGDMGDFLVEHLARAGRVAFQPHPKV